MSHILEYGIEPKKDFKINRFIISFQEQIFSMIEICNRSLVNIIEKLLDPSFLMDWTIPIDENNHGKRSHSFIIFLAKLKAVYSISSGHPRGLLGRSLGLF